MPAATAKRTPVTARLFISVPPFQGALSCHRPCATARRPAGPGSITRAKTAQRGPTHEVASRFMSLQAASAAAGAGGRAPSHGDVGKRTDDVHGPHAPSQDAAFRVWRALCLSHRAEPNGATMRPEMGTRSHVILLVTAVALAVGSFDLGGQGS